MTKIQSFPSALSSAEWPCGATHRPEFQEHWKTLNEVVSIFFNFFLFFAVLYLGAGGLAVLGLPLRHMGSLMVCVGFSCCRVWTLEHWSSVVAARKLSSCMWILVPWAGIEPTFPALEGGFLTTGSPGKFWFPSLKISHLPQKWVWQMSKLQRVGHDWSDLACVHALEKGRKWQPTPVFLPGESQG